jgi:hypothetical protein
MHAEAKRKIKKNRIHSMKTSTACIILIMLTTLFMGCDMKSQSKTISSIEYTITSGAILPEHRAHERFIITREGVTFSRIGISADTQVQEGSWEYYVEPALIAQLFLELEPFDCSQAVRVEPQDPPDGGFSEIFTLNYSDGNSCNLYFDPGVTYTNADQAVKSVLSFVGPLMIQE